MTEQKGATGPPIVIDRPAGQPTDLPTKGNMRIVELPKGMPRHDQPQQQMSTPSSSQQKGQLAPPAQKDVVAEAVRALPPEAKRDVAAEAVQALPLKTKKEIANETMAALPPEAKRDVAAEAMRDLPPEARKDAAAEAMIALSPEARKDAAAEAMNTLSSKDQEDLARRMLPSPGVADRIWQIIVWAFAVVFVLSAIAFFVAALWRAENIELLLTVVTTIAGILAGFISGRSSTGSETPGSGRTTPT